MDSLAATFDLSSAGEDRWVRPTMEADLESFQETVAAAEAWEMLGLIEILEIREEAQTGRRLINALRIRRLR